MDSVLQGMPHVIHYLLVTGYNRDEHLKNLQEVLNRLQQYGVCARSDKCMFLNYLGHQIDANGLHALEDKLDAIMNAPPLKMDNS